MTRYVINRIFLLIPIALGVTFIVFTIMNLTPSDPGRIMLGEMADREAVSQLNRELGFYDPFFVRYFNYVAGAVRLDFGVSFRSGRPVFEEIFLRFPNTLNLAFLAVICAAAVGIPLGILSAVKQYSHIDTVSRIISMLFAAAPVFFLGMMGIYIFSLRLQWLPAFGASTWEHFILPVITLSIPSAASLLRLTRSTMLETINQDYIRTARAKGASERRVIFRHALKNALLPIITILGMNFGFLLGGAILIENVFSIPGLGQLLVNSIRLMDIPQVMASTLFLALLFTLIILVVDLMYSFIDPRIKAKYSKIK
ncbi:MAG: ABC transporter permease [Defluviitaleaceae bacterium]|nr:ABC transporter permease [Defluviitaleaceae bacterium]